MATQPMTQEEPSEEASDSPSSAKELVSGIHTQLMALMDLISRSEDPEAQEELNAIVSQYQNFVKGRLGAPAGKKASPQSTPSGSVPVEAGANPNARPM